MSTVITPPTETGDTASGVAVRAREIARHYGEGETAVHALRGVDLDVQSEQSDRGHGPVGLGQVHADAHPRRPRPADARARSRSPASRSAASTTRR